VAKQKFRITNWHNGNKVLINRGAITFWLDDETIQSWYESATPTSRGRPQRYSDLAITTVLMIKRRNGVKLLTEAVAYKIEKGPDSKIIAIHYKTLQGEDVRLQAKYFVIASRTLF